MLGVQFYNEAIRKTVISFGTLFNNIELKKTIDGQTIEVEKVPLAYGPKQKFLTRIDQDSARTADNTRTVALTLPRIGFEMTTLQYDPGRKLNRIQKFRKVKGADSKTLQNSYMPVPYNVGFSLFVMAKNSEDALQIVEQVLPTFQPDYTITLNVLPQLEVVRDVPIVLNDVSYEDSYDGAFTNRRAVIYTLNFTAKTYLFGPMSNQKVVKKVQADLGADTEAPLARDERIIVVPDPSTANADDDFGFTTTLDFFADGKRFNPKTGNDE